MATVAPTAAASCCGALCSPSTASPPACVIRAEAPLDSLASLLIPFRGQPPSPRLREGYRLLTPTEPPVDDLNRLLELAGDRSRSPELWQRVLACSGWCLAVQNPQDRLVAFVRTTSDQALNANLWDLMTDPTDPARDEVLLVLVRTALARLRRELPGCSISLSAPPEALAPLLDSGFLVDPGGIRAMGLRLNTP